MFCAWIILGEQTPYDNRHIGHECRTLFRLQFRSGFKEHQELPEGVIPDVRQTVAYPRKSVDRLVEPASASYRLRRIVFAAWAITGVDPALDCMKAVKIGGKVREKKS